MFPAPAGMNRQEAQEYVGNYNVPRTSGDEPLVLLSEVLVY